MSIFKPRVRKRDYSIWKCGDQWLLKAKTGPRRCEIYSLTSQQEGFEKIKNIELDRAARKEPILTCNTSIV